MLRIIKQLFNPKSSVIPRPLPPAFLTYARKAIALITSSSGQLEAGELLTLFEANGIPADEAVELLLFLPIAFCRQLLPQLRWPDYYVECTLPNKASTCLFQDNQRYAHIQAALQEYMAGDFAQHDYLKIAGRSASFHAINQMLLDNPGCKLTEVQVTAEHLVR